MLACQALLNAIYEYKNVLICSDNKYNIILELSIIT